MCVSSFVEFSYFRFLRRSAMKQSRMSELVNSFGIGFEVALIDNGVFLREGASPGESLR